MCASSPTPCAPGRASCGRGSRGGRAPGARRCAPITVLADVGRHRVGQLPSPALRAARRRGDRAPPGNRVGGRGDGADRTARRVVEELAPSRCRLRARRDRHVRRSIPTRSDQFVDHVGAAHDRTHRGARRRSARRSHHRRSRRRVGQTTPATPADARRLRPGSRSVRPRRARDDALESPLRDDGARRRDGGAATDRASRRAPNADDLDAHDRTRHRPGRRPTDRGDRTRRRRPQLVEGITGVALGRRRATPAAAGRRLDQRRGHLGQRGTSAARRCDRCRSPTNTTCAHGSSPNSPAPVRSSRISATRWSKRSTSTVPTRRG